MNIYFTDKYYEVKWIESKRSYTNIYPFNNDLESLYNDINSSHIIVLYNSDIIFNNIFIRYERFKCKIDLLGGFVIVYPLDSLFTKSVLSKSEVRNLKLKYLLN